MEKKYGTQKIRTPVDRGFISDTGKIALPVETLTVGGGKRRWKSSVMKYVYEAVGELRKRIVRELQSSLSKGKRQNEHP
jgi:hypothetical protein